MSLKTVYGIITFDEENNLTPKNGSGDFSVSRAEEGIYIVTFQEEFSSPPSVVLTQICAEGTGNTNPYNKDGTAGSSLDNGTIVGITQKAFKLGVGDSNGSHKDRMVSFIAVGVGDTDS